MVTGGHRARPPRSCTLRVIFAGGASSRFGAPKGLARVRGERLLDRVRDALEGGPQRPVLITNDPLMAGATDLEVRRDVVSGRGPLGGLQTALQWAAERGCTGALIAGCDMPFLRRGLIERIVELGESGPHGVVVPESGHGRLEPLCAWYGVDLREEVRRRLARGEGSLSGLISGVTHLPVPVREVRRHGDPPRLFFNVNSREDLVVAERLAVHPE